MNLDRMMSWYSSVPARGPESAHVLVLAGGRGTRLRASNDPLLRTTPKLMVPLGSTKGSAPMLDIALSELTRLRYHRVSLLTSRDPAAGGAAIEAYSSARYGDQLTLSAFREEYPLGTAGAVYAAMRYIEEDLIIVVPGDTLFPFDSLNGAVAAHSWQDAATTWVVTTRPGESAQNAGALLVDPATSRIAFALEGLDLNPAAEVAQRLVRATSTGVLILDRRYFVTAFEQYVSRLDEPAPTDLYRQFVPWLLSRAEPVYAYDVQSAAPDLGTPERLATFGHQRTSTTTS